MKLFLVLFAIFIGVYGGDVPMNLDSPPLLEVVKGLLDKALKTMANVPALKEKALANYTRNTKEALSSYYNCPPVRVLQRDLQSIGENSVAHNDALTCNALLNRTTSMIDNTYNTDVRNQMDSLLAEIDDLNNSEKPKIDKIKNVLQNYVVKYESCSDEELKNQTCGALLEFEKVLQLYRVKMHDYTVELTLAASFVGKFADNAWQKVEEHLKEKVLDPVNDCVAKNDLDEHYENISH